MKRHALVIAAFMLATFVTQAGSHFLVNAEHYQAIPYLRAQPVFAFGFLAMVVQGWVLSWLYSMVSVHLRGVVGAMAFSWAMGAFLVAYMAFAEAAKYAVPSVPAWIVVESSSGLVQFTVFGLLLSRIFREPVDGRGG